MSFSSQFFPENLGVISDKHWENFIKNFNYENEVPRKI